MKLSKMILSVLVAISFFLTAGSSRAETPGIYMLFVWGTLDPDTRSHAEISKRKIEAAFATDNSSYATTARNEGLHNTAGKLVELNPYIKRKITLEGSDAHPKKILDACKELANAAGPNDTVMVYILCHGATIKGKDNKLRHLLAPIATNANDLEINKYGIARGSILYAIKSKPHRLDVLITDSCSVRVPFKAIEPPDDYSFAGQPNRYLTNFLLKARGELNINSSRPESAQKSAEKARSLSSEKWRDVPSDNGSRQVYELYGGTVFTNAFLNVAETNEFIPERDLTVDAFFEKLWTELDNQYFETKKYLYATKQIDILTDQFMDQDTQTLTRFNYDSVAWPGDLTRESKHKYDSLSEDSSDSSDGSF